MKLNIVNVEYCDYEEEMQKQHMALTVPFLYPKPTKEYTLVLDLDETLVYFSEESKNKQVLIRPFA
jgi:predicted HAD superfamily phosphohydrolase YqeG